MQVVQRRVDSLTLAYRVELHDHVMRALQERQTVAREHGRAAFVLQVGRHELDFGELRFSRVANVWNITKEPRFRIRIDLHAPGAVVDPHDEKKREPGWTIEVVWYAQTLANRSLEGILQDTRTLMGALGVIFEERCRRIDLCADVAGLDVATIDPRNIIKRSRARDTDYENQPKATRKGSRHDDEGTEASVFRNRRVSGIVVGRDALACRIYDKPAELARETRHLHGDPKCGCRRCAEEGRWRDGGWDGVEPVTRIEYQVRGVAMKEFGCQNPAACVELVKNGKKLTLGRVLTLPEYLDALWQALLDWARVAEPSADGVRSRWEDTEAWQHLRKVRFSEGDARPAGRARMRGAASGAQALGSALSYAAQRGALTKLDERADAYSGGGEEKEWSRLVGLVRNVLGECIAEPIARELVARWESVSLACAHLAVRQNAAIARFVGNETSLIEQLQQRELKGAYENECRVQQCSGDGLSPG